MFQNYVLRPVLQLGSGLTVSGVLVQRDLFLFFIFSIPLFSGAKIIFIYGKTDSLSLLVSVPSLSFYLFVRSILGFIFLEEGAASCCCSCYLSASPLLLETKVLQ